MTKYSDPCYDPLVQAELDAILERVASPRRYAVVFAVSRKSNGFYDFSSGCWEWNRVPVSTLFVDQEVALAAATALSRLRQKQGGQSVIFGRTTRPLQVVALRITRIGCRFEGKVSSLYETYVPAPLTFRADK